MGGFLTVSVLFSNVIIGPRGILLATQACKQAGWEFNII